MSKPFCAAKRETMAEQRPIQIVVRKPVLSQERPLACALSGEIAGRIIPRDMRVVLGCPLGVIHAVDDPGDRTVPAEKSVQTETVLGRLNLASVALADGADGVAPGDAGFEKIHVCRRTPSCSGFIRRGSSASSGATRGAKMP